MAKSMTGYGRYQAQLNERDISVEIKAVNHRYFDFSCRISRVFGFMEERLKRLVQESVARGKVDVSVSINLIKGPDVEVALNEPLLRSYLSALQRIADEHGVHNDITVSAVARNADIFNVVRQDEDAEELWRDVSTVAGEALHLFMEMRVDEGRRLTEDLLARLDTIAASLPAIEDAAQRSCDIYRANLIDTVQELLREHGLEYVDEGRIVAEVALYSEKTNITEELVRLRSHLEEMKKMLRDDRPSGRKMDFLLQEMNREINTIGSKSQINDISMLVVENKAELEKIREQVQNLE